LFPLDQISRHAAAAWRIADGADSSPRAADCLKVRWTAVARRRPSRATTLDARRLTVGVFGFPENLADKAKKLGIPIRKFGREMEA
jgi:hypothetical protein